MTKTRHSLNSLDLIRSVGQLDSTVTGHKRMHTTTSDTVREMKQVQRTAIDSCDLCVICDFFDMRGYIAFLLLNINQEYYGKL